MKSEDWNVVVWVSRSGSGSGVRGMGGGGGETSVLNFLFKD